MKAYFMGSAMPAQQRHPRQLPSRMSRRRCSRPTSGNRERGARNRYGKGDVREQVPTLQRSQSNWGNSIHIYRSGSCPR